MATERFCRIKPSSNSSLALSVHNVLGVSLQQSSDTNLHQIWRCEELGGGTQGFVLVHQATSRALSWKQAGHKVRLDPYLPKAPTPQQVWVMTNLADSPNSAKKITPFQDSSVCLDMKTGSIAGSEIFTASWRGSPNQQWVTVDLPEGSLYPLPLASHAEVANDQHLFLTTLSHLHSYLGNTLKIPLMGGKELDLHLLYREVTRRGGLAQVTLRKRWKDVAKTFRLPPTITSASFVMRKYYTGLLHHYEQLYFFGARGPLVPPLSMLPTSFPKEPRIARIQPELYGIDIQLTTDLAPRKAGKRKRSTEEAGGAAPEDPQEMLGHTVTGVIHAKFELGYFVTVQVGNETLRGILYHPPKGASPHPHSILEPKAIAEFLKQRKDSGLPLGTIPEYPSSITGDRSAFDLFYSEWHDRLKEMNPDATDEECALWLAEQWRSLPAENKKTYEDVADAEKARLGREAIETAQEEVAHSGAAMVGDDRSEGEGEGELQTGVGQPESQLRARIEEHMTEPRSHLEPEVVHSPEAKEADLDDAKVALEEDTALMENRGFSLF